MNGLRQIGDVLASEAVLVANPAAQIERAGRAGRGRHDAERGHRRSRAEVPDDERPGGVPGRPPGAPAGPRIADGHPARPRGDDRDPLGRGRRRGVGPPAAPQGRRRVRDPGPADREDRRRDDRDARHHAPTSAGWTCATWPPAIRPRCASTDALIRRGAVPDPRGPRRRPRHPRRRPGPRRRTPSATANRAVGGGRPDGRLVLDAGRAPRRRRRASSRPSGARSTRRSTTSAASPRPSARARPARRSRPASRSSAAGRRSRASAPTSPAAPRRTRRRWS